MTTKIHAIVDALGNPLAVSLTGGDVHDVTQAQLLTQKIEPAALLADEGYDTGGFIEHLFKSAASSPPFRRGQIARRRASATSRSIASATILERFFNIIKHFRAMATRYEKTARNFLAGVHLVCALAWLK